MDSSLLVLPLIKARRGRGSGACAAGTSWCVNARSVVEYPRDSNYKYLHSPKKSSNVQLASSQIVSHIRWAFSIFDRSTTRPGTLRFYDLCPVLFFFIYHQHSAAPFLSPCSRHYRQFSLSPTHTNTHTHVPDTAIDICTCYIIVGAIARLHHTPSYTAGVVTNLSSSQSLLDTMQAFLENATLRCAFGNEVFNYMENHAKKNAYLQEIHYAHLCISARWR